MDNLGMAVDKSLLQPVEPLQVFLLLGIGFVLWAPSQFFRAFCNRDEERANHDRLLLEQLQF